MRPTILMPLAVTAAMLLSGCATMPTVDGRYKKAEEISQRAGFEKSYFKAKEFTLTVYTRINRPGEPVTVYIEGDGTAYLTRSRVSMDPTPSDPTALRLAALDPGENVAYIARPGQYCRGLTPDCDDSYWTRGRFSEEVISSVNEAISYVSDRAQSRQVDLVGFSGGAAIACLAAARRNDVASVRTVAGNLDPDAVNRFHKVDGLKDSINPMSAALRLSGIPQLHFIGGRDTVILPSVAYDFAKRSGDFTGKTVIVVSNAGHNKGWADCWPGLLKMRPIKPSE